MSSDHAETASQALRELARWVVRDGVDSDHLEAYMNLLLNKRLIELHASCRCQAIVVARCFAGLGAADVAAHLRRSACELEKSRSVSGASASLDRRQQIVSPPAERRMVTPIPDRRREGSSGRHASSWLPELVAGAVFIAMCVALLLVQCSDSTIRVIAAILFGFLGFIYTVAAMRLAWRNAQPRGWR